MSTLPAVVVGMSGGVDSGVAAFLAKEAGFRVVGVMLQIKEAGVSRDADEAAFLAVAEKLGVECRIEKVPEFQDKVILPAAEMYAAGCTPNPCCICNAAVKIPKLLEIADALGASHVWTGHYATLRNGRLYRGTDREKDQSYFLYRLDEKMRRRLVFPLGGKTKQQVRALATELDLPVASRPDSQDVCFGTANESCGETLRRRAGLPEKIGYFRFRGKIVGSHRCVHGCTVGQRSGLGVALGVPAYVKSICGETGDVELETDLRALETTRFYLDDVVLHDETLPGRAQICIRYRGKTVGAALKQENNRIAVTLDEALRAVAPGQAGVFYRDELLAGGGVISPA